MREVARVFGERQVCERREAGLFGGQREVFALAVRGHVEHVELVRLGYRWASHVRWRDFRHARCGSGHRGESLGGVKGLA